MSLRLYIAAVVALAACEANAQTKASAQTKATEEIETVLVTGARIEGASAASAEVIDAQTLTLQNGATALELLRNRVGIDVVQPGGPGGITELFIRGAESNFTVVTVDGVRMNDTTNSRGGGFDLSTLNPDEIERVEILRGPLSSIYGSDALAGAINIKTKSPRNAAPFSARVEGGNHGYARVYGGVAFGGGNNTAASGPAVNLSVAHLDAGEPVPGSSATTESYAAAVDWVDNNERAVDTTIRKVSRERTGYPSASGGYEFAASDELERAQADDLSVGFSWREQVSNNAKLNLNVTHYKRDEYVNTPAVDGGVLGSPIPAAVSDSALARTKVVGYSSFTLSPTLQMVAGVSAEKEKGENNTVYDYGFPLPAEFDLLRNTQSVFAELNYSKPQAIDVFISTRFDSAEQLDKQTDELSSKLAFSYPLFANGRVGVSWGQAFKLPSFYAVGDSLVGNPELKPETSTTSEAFIEHFYSNGKLRVSGAVFKSEYKNLIDFDFATFKMVNLDEVDISGVEVETLARLSPNFEVGGHITYTSFDVQSGEPLDGRPNWRGGVFGEWRSSNWSARLHWAYTGERPSTSTATGQVELAGFNRMDFAVARVLSKRVTLSMNIDNVFDSAYQDEVGFPSPGLGGRLGVSYSH